MGHTSSNHATIVHWVHDESISYANNHCQSVWYHKDTTAMPYTKGEGASLMIANFVLANYGWLYSPDGIELVCIIFHLGKGQDGYFTTDEVIAQAEVAMNILAKYYLNEDHFFTYRNASTHLAWPPEALSANKILKNPSNPKKNFGVLVNIIGHDRKSVYGPDGKILKEKI